MSKLFDCSEPSTLTSISYERNADQSPLLQLPPELRNMIWAFVLEDESTRSTMNQKVPHFFHICCQVTAETTTLAYDTQTMNIPSVKDLRSEYAYRCGYQQARNLRLRLCADQVSSPLPQFITFLKKLKKRFGTLERLQRLEIIISCSGIHNFAWNEAIPKLILKHFEEFDVCIGVIHERSSRSRKWMMM